MQVRQGAGQVGLHEASPHRTRGPPGGRPQRTNREAPPRSNTKQGLVHERSSDARGKCGTIRGKVGEDQIEVRLGKVMEVVAIRKDARQDRNEEAWLESRVGVVSIVDNGLRARRAGGRASVPKCDNVVDSLQTGIGDMDLRVGKRKREEVRAEQVGIDVVVGPLWVVSGVDPRTHRWARAGGSGRRTHKSPS